MEQYKQDFILFMIESNVLLFGDFVTKSGRKTPFFINTGKYKTGAQIKKLGSFYAKAIYNNLKKDDFSVLFGPAYKGIPLVVTVASEIFSEYNQDVAYCFNRKELKDHGEGGLLVGKKLEDGDEVLIIEDVTTAGTSIRETVPILKKNANIKLAGLVVSVDRQERGLGTSTALKELSKQFEMKTFAIVTMSEILEFLYNRKINGKILIDDEIKSKIDEYYQKYGE
jgi:orotate phosphoribosyltransferase